MGAQIFVCSYLAVCGTYQRRLRPRKKKFVSWLVPSPSNTTVVYTRQALNMMVKYSMYYLKQAYESICIFHSTLLNMNTVNIVCMHVHGTLYMYCIVELCLYYIMLVTGVHGGCSVRVKDTRQAGGLVTERKTYMTRWENKYRSLLLCMSAVL